MEHGGAIWDLRFEISKEEERRRRITKARKIENAKEAELEI
jgi:hypothetical protein